MENTICQSCGSQKTFHKAGENKKTGKKWKDFWGCDNCFKNKKQVQPQKSENISNIGALWVKESKDRKYMSGQIEVDGRKINIVVFKNDRKQKENHPDYNILLSTKRVSNVVETKAEMVGTPAEEEFENLPF